VKTDFPIDTCLKRLHLANARRVWRDLCSRAEKEEWAYEHLLAVLLGEEVAHRQQTRLQKAARDARFPFLKTVDDFNFTYQSTVRLPIIGSYLSADFVTEGRSLILHGKPGRGKTHLAIAIAYRAIQNGFDALFVTAASLIEELSVASRQGRLREAVAAYTHPHVLVVDEVGYLAYGDDAANVLYHVVNERHLKRRSMIFTTNKSLDAWGAVLHDQDLASAITDRILERGRLLKLDGPSIRTKHLGLDDPTQEASTQPAIVSGISRQEFPEPTLVIGPFIEAVRGAELVHHGMGTDTEGHHRVRVLPSLLLGDGVAELTRDERRMCVTGRPAILLGLGHRVSMLHARSLERRRVRDLLGRAYDLPSRTTARPSISITSPL